MNKILELVSDALGALMKLIDPFRFHHVPYLGVIYMLLLTPVFICVALALALVYSVYGCVMFVVMLGLCWLPDEKFGIERGTGHPMPYHQAKAGHMLNVLRVYGMFLVGTILLVTLASA